MSTLLQQAKSKTMVAATVMTSIQGAATALTFLEPVLTQKEFAIVSAVMAFVAPIVMGLLRQKTTMPISEK